MSDFKLSAEILLQANQALRDIEKVKKATKQSQKEFEILGKKATLDLKQIGLTLGVLTGVMGGFLSVIIGNSPQVAESMALMELAAFELGVELGDNLAWIINNTLLPAMQGLVKITENMPEPIQDLVIITASLTLAIGLLTVAVIALSAASLPLILGILAVSLAIAAVIVFIKNWNNTNNLLIDILLILIFLIAVVIIAALLGFSAAGIALVVVIAAIVLAFILFIKYSEKIGKFIVGIGEWVLDLSDGFDRLADAIGHIPVIGGILAFFLGTLLLPFQLIIDIVGSIIIIFGDLITAIGALFTGNFDLLGESLVNIVITIVNVIIRTINRVAGLFNSFLSGLDTAAKLIGQRVTFRVGTMDELSRAGEESLGSLTDKGTGTGTTTKTPSGSANTKAFGEGGTIDKTGLIFAHRQEEILRPVEARQFRAGQNGGGGSAVFNNTFNIGSVRSQSDIRAIATEVARIQKQQMNRRVNI